MIVTRQLSPIEFGTWGLINGVIVYAVIIHPIISYWSLRETARGENSGKTAIVSTGMLSVIGIGIYLIIAYVVGLQSNVDVSILLFAGILVPVLFINEALGAIISGFKPHVKSLGFLVFEIIKIPVALLLVYYLQMGLEGAILATFFAYLANNVFLAKNAREKLSVKLERSYIKKWLKMFWVPLYRKIPSLISMSDVIVFSVITGSVVGVAYYTAARTIGFLVWHSRAIGIGVYPKLLSGGHEKTLQNNLEIFFYVAIPLIFLSITFAKPGLFILNPLYAIAATVVILLSIRQFLTSLNELLFAALQGIEKVDSDISSTYKDYLKSNLVLYPTFQMIRHGVYISSLVLILIIMGIEQKAEIELVTYWAIIGLIVEIPLSIYIIRLSNKSISIKLNWIRLSKYFFTAFIVFGSTYFIMEQYLEYQESIFYFLPRAAIFAIGSILAYIGITYLIEEKTRILVKAMIKEIIKKKKK